jgi:hypothetical protein
LLGFVSARTIKGQSSPSDDDVFYLFFQKQKRA